LKKEGKMKSTKKEKEQKKTITNFLYKDLELT